MTLNRNEMILLHIDKKGSGIEIGPSHAPIASKKAGYKVQIIDHLDRKKLIEKYKESNVHLENIEEVDFIWNGESYADLTGRHNYYDWIIASHVIEHTPDLIGFLKDCEGILNENGVLSLAIPNSTCCFDYFRPITGISKVIDAHFSENKIHTPGTAAEHILNVASRDGRPTWHRKSHNKGKFSFYHSSEDARKAMDHARTGLEYQDFHAWCFTPHSFRLLIHDLFFLGLISIREISFFPTEDFEFFITLGRKGVGSKLSRLEMLQEFKSEMSVFPRCSEMFRINLKSLINRCYKRVRSLRNGLC